MSRPNIPFTILLIESDENVALVIARMTARTFPEALLHRTSTLEAAIRHLENKAVAPRLILLASHKRADSDSGEALEAFTGHPLIRSHPVLLLEREDSTVQVSQSYQQGIAACHTKPETDADWQTLLTAIRSFWFVQARLVLH